jgi:glycosyltransferase involved in cell wall biosynthesis
VSEPKGRILVLFGSVPLYGHERENIETIAALRDEGWDALFVTHDEWGHEAIQPALDAVGLPWTTATFADRFDRGMGVGGWLRRFGQMVRGSWQLWRIMRSYRPTHIHLGHPQWFVAFLPVLLLSRTPLIYRLGDRPATHRLAFRVLWRWVIAPRVDRFVCISQYLLRELTALAPVAHKATVLYPRPARRPAGGGVEDLPPRAEGVLTFVYVGQITEEKGVGLIVQVALRICRERTDVRFLLAGDYSWRNPFAERLLATVREEGLAERIRFLGYVHDVNALLSVAQVHLCPSLVLEGFGTTVLEAKQAGLPSVIFPSGGLAETVCSGVDGIVCGEKSAAALEAACRWYLEDPERAIRHGAAARASLARFAPDRFAQRWDVVYASVAR